MNRFRCSLTLTAVLALAPGGSATASSLSYEGDTLVMRAAPGERNFVVVDGDSERVTFTDDHAIAFPADRCTQIDASYPVSCETPAAAVRIELGDGEDHGSFGFSIPADRAFTIDGGPGADLLKGPRNGVGRATLDGGEGDDDLRSEESPDTLLGSGGTDKLQGGGNADVLRGGDGDDLLRDDDGSSPSADVLDGGAGSDLLDSYRDGDPALAAPVDILLDGVANDGREGEGDNIVAVERFDVGAVRTFAGDAADNAFRAPEVGSAVRLSGGDGADVLNATDSHGDEVDGGNGDDTLDGGMGDDRLVGGPGRDTIAGDRPARCNELHCDITEGYGNDTIDVRDGEVDSVQCGPGVDRVLADPADLVTDDCEQVDGRPAPSASLAVVGPRSVRAVLRRGLVVQVPAQAAVRALAGRVVVARGAGTGRVRLRLTPAGRARLRRGGPVALDVVAAGRRVRVTLTAR